MSLVLVIVVFWSTSASADLFYTTVDDGYAAGSGGIVSKVGSDFTVAKDRVANLGGDTGSHVFLGADGVQRLLIREFTYSTGDAVYIYNLKDDPGLTAPFNTADWKATNIRGVAAIGNYLYVAAEVADYTSPQPSGEVIKIDISKSDYPVVGRYKFQDHASGLKRHVQGIRAYNGSLYVLANATDYTAYEPAEVFKLDPNNLASGPAGSPVLIDKNAGSMCQPLAIYGDKLYIACHGHGAAGSFWEVNMGAMTSTKVIDLAAIPELGDTFAGSGIAFANDGTALLLVADGWNPSKIFVTTAENLSNSALTPAQKIGAPAANFTPAEGYSFGIEYDSEDAVFWIMNGNNLEVRSGGGSLLKTYTPAELGDNVYSIAVVNQSNDNSDNGDNDNDNNSGGTSGGGGGCDAGLGAFALSFVVSGALLRHRRR
jgi:hypothetical protein